MALVKRACLVLVLFCACAITSSWFPALELLRSFVNASSLPSSFASQSSVFRSAVDDSSGLSGWFTLVEERCARLIDVEEGSRCVSRGRTWATAEPGVVSHVVGGGQARATDELEGFQRECLCSLGTTCLPAGAVDLGTCGRPLWAGPAPGSATHKVNREEVSLAALSHSTAIHSIHSNSRAEVGTLTVGLSGAQCSKSWSTPRPELHGWCADPKGDWVSGCRLTAHLDTPHSCYMCSSRTGGHHTIDSTHPHIAIPAALERVTCVTRRSALQLSGPGMCNFTEPGRAACENKAQTGGRSLCTSMTSHPQPTWSASTSHIPSPPITLTPNVSHHREPNAHYVGGQSTSSVGCLSVHYSHTPFLLYLRELRKGSLRRASRTRVRVKGYTFSTSNPLHTHQVCGPSAGGVGVGSVRGWGRRSKQAEDVSSGRWYAPPPLPLGGGGRPPGPLGGGGRTLTDALRGRFDAPPPPGGGPSHPSGGVAGRGLSRLMLAPSTWRHPLPRWGRVLSAPMHPAAPRVHGGVCATRHTVHPAPPRVQVYPANPRVHSARACLLRMPTAPFPPPFPHS